MLLFLLTSDVRPAYTIHIFWFYSYTYILRHFIQNDSFPSILHPYGNREYFIGFKTKGIRNGRFFFFFCSDYNTPRPYVHQSDGPIDAIRLFFKSHSNTCRICEFRPLILSISVLKIVKYTHL